MKIFEIRKTIETAKYNKYYLFGFLLIGIGKTINVMKDE